jgi:hypothetical protein
MLNSKFTDTKNSFFTIKTPCKDCPFRNDVRPYLTRKRVKEIRQALENDDKTFSCHKTVDYSRTKHDKHHNHKPSSTEKQCAGALILLNKDNTLQNNFLFRFALMTKLLILSELIGNDIVYDSFEEMINAQDF